MRHLNPWADDEGFMFLETVNHGIMNPDGSCRPLAVDLYVLETPTTVHFGARFSDKDSDYESGEWLKGTDTLYVGQWTGRAAALYFMRKLKEVTQ